jgi:hypothetical protein
MESESNLASTWVVQIFTAIIGDDERRCVIKHRGLSDAYVLFVDDIHKGAWVSYEMLEETTDTLAIHSGHLC